MKNLKENLLEAPFAHIYIEKRALHYQETKDILAKLPGRRMIEINHYKDVFNRSRQSFPRQKQAPALILAVRDGEFLYQGAPVCQNFNQDFFYYTSTAMNCIYDCEYCYLQGMYPSAHIVVFVNIQDYFHHIKERLARHPVYLCISYDTDLLPLETLTGHVKQWADFAARHDGLTIELRTKCANTAALTLISPVKNFIIAYTLSPQEAIRQWEHKTPSLEKRLKAVSVLADAGFTLRLCLDPVIRYRGWEESYQEMILKMTASVSPEMIKDVSLGVFRISKDYLKQMRRQRPDSVILSYPYETENGYCHYGNLRSREVTAYVRQLLLPYFPPEKLFIWQDANNINEPEDQ